jgi:hypothetical protein
MGSGASPTQRQSLGCTRKQRQLHPCLWGWPADGVPSTRRALQPASHAVAGHVDARHPLLRQPLHQQDQ